MADITMCNGEGCNFRESCKRYTSSPGEYQSYFLEPPIKDNKCEMYWGEQSESIYNMLKEILKQD